MTETAISITTDSLRFQMQEPVVSSDGSIRPFQVHELTSRLSRIDELLALAAYLVAAEEAETSPVADLFVMELPEVSEHQLVWQARLQTQENFPVRRFTYASTPDLWLYLGTAAGTGGVMLSAVALRNFVMETASKVMDLWEKFSRVRRHVAVQNVNTEFAKLLHDEVRAARRMGETQEIDGEVIRLINDATLALEEARQISIEQET